MKVPTKMWGKGRPDLALLSPEYRLNESPPKRKGNVAAGTSMPGLISQASMKAPPKRKGNDAQPPQPRPANCLNESPSRKEGKSALAREGMLGESDPQ